jgi:hypothetical protein
MRTPSSICSGSSRRSPLLRRLHQRTSLANVVLSRRCRRGERPLFPLRREQPREHGGAPWLSVPDRTDVRAEGANPGLARRLRGAHRSRAGVRVHGLQGSCPRCNATEITRPRQSVDPAGCAGLRWRSSLRASCSALPPLFPRTSPPFRCSGWSRSPIWQTTACSSPQSFPQPAMLELNFEAAGRKIYGAWSPRATATNPSGVSRAAKYCLKNASPKRVPRSSISDRFLAQRLSVRKPPRSGPARTSPSTWPRSFSSSRKSGVRVTT